MIGLQKRRGGSERAYISICMQRQKSTTVETECSDDRKTDSAAKKEKKMEGLDFNKKEIIEDVVVIVGLVMVQFLYAGNSILLSYLLKLGVEPSSLIIFSTFATFLVLSPLSILFERQITTSLVVYHTNTDDVIL